MNEHLKSTSVLEERFQSELFLPKEMMAFFPLSDMPLLSDV